MELLNVVENVDGAIYIDSFVIANEENKQALVKDAEELYRKKAVANGAYTDIEMFEEEIGYDVYENDTYSVSLIWSNEVTTIEK